MVIGVKHSNQNSSRSNYDREGNVAGDRTSSPQRLRKPMPTVANGENRERSRVAARPLI